MEGDIDGERATSVDAEFARTDEPAMREDGDVEASGAEEPSPQRAGRGEREERQGRRRRRGRRGGRNRDRRQSGTQPDEGAPHAGDGDPQELAARDHAEAAYVGRDMVEPIAVEAEPAARHDETALPAETPVYRDEQADAPGDAPPSRSPDLPEITSPHEEAHEPGKAPPSRSPDCPEITSPRGEEHEPSHAQAAEHGAEEGQGADESAQPARRGWWQRRFSST
jgi:ribonuclease E